MLPSVVKKVARQHHPSSSAVEEFKEFPKSYGPTTVQSIPNTNLRIGVIGVGNMGQHHTRVLSLLKDVELIGVADLNVERGLDLASKYRIRYFEDYHALLPSSMRFALRFLPSSITKWA